MKPKKRDRRSIILRDLGILLTGGMLQRLCILADNTPGIDEETRKWIGGEIQERIPTEEVNDL